MPRNAQDVTDAELAILEVLWAEGTVTVRRIREVLSPDSEGSQHATVQKLLDRLRAKRFVKRQGRAWPYLYRAEIARDELIGQRLRTTADRFCGGSLQPLLTHLIRQTGLSQKERRSLRKALDEYDDSAEDDD